MIAYKPSQTPSLAFKDVGCRSNFDPSRPLYTQDTSFSVKSSLTAVRQGVQTLSTDIFACFGSTPSRAGTQRRQHLQHLHRSAAAAPTARMRRVQQPMLRVSPSVILTSCDYRVCSPASITFFFQLVSSPRFHVAHIPKGNYIDYVIDDSARFPPF